MKLNVILTGDDGAETTRNVDYQVPIGAQPGQLYFTVSDAMRRESHRFPPDPHLQPAQPAAS